MGLFDMNEAEDLNERIANLKRRILESYDDKDSIFDIEVSDRQDMIYEYLDSYGATCSAHELGRYVFNIITYAPDSEQKAIYKAATRDDRIESIKIGNTRRFYVP